MLTNSQVIKISSHFLVIILSYFIQDNLGYKEAKQDSINTMCTISSENIIKSFFPNCEVIYVPTLAQHRQTLPKIGYQYRAVAEMITTVCTWQPILAQTLTANSCFRHIIGPMPCQLWFPHFQNGLPW